MTRRKPVHILYGLHPAIFVFYALYLCHMPLFPFVNLAFPFTDYRTAITFQDFPRTSQLPTIAMSVLRYTGSDEDPDKMTVARKLMQAYLMGYRMEAPHFLDTIINAIIKYFRADEALSPVFVSWIYTEFPSINATGIKKLIVDYYVWCSTYDSDKTPSLSKYAAAFQIDVKAAMDAIATQVVIDPKDPKKRTEPQDVVVDFTRLENFLCHQREGRLKCRYHHHPPKGFCYNLIVDDERIEFDG